MSRFQDDICLENGTFHSMYHLKEVEKNSEHYKEAFIHTYSTDNRQNATSNVKQTFAKGFWQKWFRLKFSQTMIIAGANPCRILLTPE